MNKIQITRNTNVRKYIDIMDGTYRNHVRLNKHNSKKHEMTKAEICYWLLKHNKEFLTECRLNNLENIIDIFVTDNATIIEVMHTETEKRLNEKVDNYPKGVNVIAVNTAWKEDDLSGLL